MDAQRLFGMIADCKPSGWSLSLVAMGWASHSLPGSAKPTILPRLHSLTLSSRLLPDQILFNPSQPTNLGFSNISVIRLRKFNEWTGLLVQATISCIWPTKGISPPPPHRIELAEDVHIWQIIYCLWVKQTCNEEERAFLFTRINHFKKISILSFSTKVVTFCLAPSSLGSC